MEEESGGKDPPDKDSNSNLSTTQACLEAMEIVRNIDYEENKVNLTQDNQLLEFFGQKRRGETDINPGANIKKTNVRTNNEETNNTTNSNNNVNLSYNSTSTTFSSANNQPSSSIQATNTPNMNKTPYDYNKENRYSNNDKCEYFILIESSDDRNIGNLHFMSLGKLLMNKFKLNNGELIDIRKVGRNRIKVQLNNSDLANNILNSDVLKTNSLRAYIPETVLYRKAVIRNVDPDLTTDEIKQVIITPIPIKEMRRITRRVENNGVISSLNTQTIIINFRGQNLPDFVSIYGARCRVNPYVYRVLQCENCYMFGHSSRQCRTKFRCTICGDKHDTKTCTNTIQSVNKQFCINCSGDHPVTDKMCPHYLKQVQIKKYMAKHNVGYKVAKDQYKTFSEAVSRRPQTNDLNDYPLLPHINNRYSILANYNDQTNNEQTTIPTVFNNPRRAVINRPQSFNTRIYKPSASTSQQSASQNTTSQQGSIVRNPYAPQPHLASGQSQSSGSENCIVNLYSLVSELIAKNNGTNISLEQFRDWYSSSFMNQSQHGQI